MDSKEVEKLFVIRPFTEFDLSFIFATWLRGLYYGNSWFREIDKDLFMENYHRVVEAILARPTVEVSVACLKDDPNTILGYVVLERTRQTLHWAFVKEVWRRFGIAKKLIDDQAAITSVTHLTSVGRSLKPEQIKFNPFLV